MAVTPDDPEATPDDSWVAHAPDTPLDVAFRCDVARFEERAIVGLRGDVDLARAPAFERELFATLAAPIRGVVVDLGYCTFMDGSGAAVLFAAASWAVEQGIDFMLTSVPRQVRVVLELSGLTEELGLPGDTGSGLPPTSPGGAAP